MNPQLKKMRDLVEKATPGPWFISGNTEGRNWSIIQTNHTTRDIWKIPREPEDYKLIVKSRTLLPLLLDIIEAGELNEKQKELLASYESCE